MSIFESVKPLFTILHDPRLCLMRKQLVKAMTQLTITDETTERALRLYEQAYGLLHSQHYDQEDRDFAACLAKICAEWAHLLRCTTRYEEVPQLLEEAVQALRKVSVPFSYLEESSEAVQERALQRLPQPFPCLDETTLLESLGCYYADIGEPAVARQWYMKALDAHPRWQIGKAPYRATQHRIGLMVWRLGDTEGAADILKDAVEYARGSEDGSAIDLSVYLSDLAMVYEALNRGEEAWALHQEAQENWESGWCAL